MTAANLLRGRYGKSDFLAQCDNALDGLADLLGDQLAECTQGPYRGTVTLAYQHSAYHGIGGDACFLALLQGRSSRLAIRNGESVD